MKKALFLNTFDKEGGAAIAAYRILDGVRKHTDCNAEMLVNRKGSTPYFVHGAESGFELLKAVFRNPLEKLALLPYPKREKVIFSSALVPNYRLFREIININPDILHLHWINAGFFRLEQLKKIKKPIVWTLHDMWAFTGGCHYSGGCDKYASHCGNCPVLNSKKQKDLAFNTFKNKQNLFKNLNLTLVCPSKWLTECAGKSELFKNNRIINIPYGLNLELFRPIEKNMARKLLNLPLERKLILFGALNSLEDERKGSKYLFESLKILENEFSEDVELVIFGADKPEKPLEIKFITHYTGTVKDEITLALLYSACDVMAVPSKEDNLPNTALEATCCGTPVVTFNIGGLPDIVDHKNNGWLAKPFEAKELAEGIKWILSLNQSEYTQISINARKKAEENFDIRAIATKYYDLYNELC
jgi:glycosyltransferase involved in cell wall biosynthesis